MKLLIVDDRSDDNTPKILRGYCKKDSRIRLVTNDKNLGLPTSLNADISQSTASFIARADGDDVNDYSRLGKQLEFMAEQSEVDVLGAGAFLISANSKIKMRMSLPETNTELYGIPYTKTLFFHPSRLIRRCFFEGVGLYDGDYDRADDMELWMGGMMYGCQYANLKEPLICYSTNNDIRSWTSIWLSVRSLYRIHREYRRYRGLYYLAKAVASFLLVKLCIRRPREKRLRAFSP